MAGKTFVELPESDVCCGSAGSYNLTEPAMAERLQRRKIENILRTGAQVVVTTNPGVSSKSAPDCRRRAPTMFECYTSLIILRRRRRFGRMMFKPAR